MVALFYYGGDGVKYKGRAFLLWNKGRVRGKLVPLRGLTKRRRAEVKIFEEGIYDSTH